MAEKLWCDNACYTWEIIVKEEEGTKEEYNTPYNDQNIIYIKKL